jgi:predicted MFS family arabinose efflux permease
VAGLRSRLTLDLTPLRVSRNFRLLEIGSLITGMGTQAALVAIPYQVFTITHSPALTGLLGAVELVPLIGFSLYGGAIADRMDRRLLLLWSQIALATTSALLAVIAFGNVNEVWLIFILAGALAGFGGFEGVARSAIVPNVVEPELLRPALAFSFGLSSLTMVIGPALGGILIATAGLGPTYAADAVSCGAMAIAAALMTAQLPPPGIEHDPVWASIKEGLRFVRGEQALLGSFAIDLLAMTFGMPRALFAALAISVYHEGAAGTGALYASVAIGATAAALTAGWLNHARWLGRIVIGAVIVWGLAIAAAGLMTSIVPACLFLAIAGAADSVSAVSRSTINQTVTPDAMRGRMSSVFQMVVRSGPRLGDIESGAVAGAAETRYALGPSVRISVVSGGLFCVVGVFVIMALFPALARYGADEPVPAAA